MRMIRMWYDGLHTITKIMFFKLPVLLFLLFFIFGFAYDWFLWNDPFASPKQISDLSGTSVFTLDILQL